MTRSSFDKFGFFGRDGLGTGRRRFRRFTGSGMTGPVRAAKIDSISLIAASRLCGATIRRRLSAPQSILAMIAPATR